jgi:hypothetical protein
MPGIVLKPSDRRAPNSLAVNDPGAYGAVTGLTSHGEEGILEGVHGVQKTCHNGQPDLRLTADTETWLRFLRREANLVWALVRRKIRIQGSPKLLLAFGRCFPS